MVNNDSKNPSSKIFVKIKTSDTPSKARLAPIKAETPHQDDKMADDDDGDADNIVEVLNDVEMKDEEEAEKAKGLVKLKNHSSGAILNNANSNVVSIKCTPKT